MARGVFFGVALLVASALALRSIVSRTIIAEDRVKQLKHLVIENWSGDERLFAPAHDVARRYGVRDVATIIFDQAYRDTVSRREVLVAARDGGFDTTRIRLIRVPREEPKTLNIARAVTDSARAWGWHDITLATAELHSARSRKAYTREAARYGIRVQVVGLPYLNVTAENWYKTPGGLAEAVKELGKRAFYEIAVF